jgi:hypothetical protein
MDMVDLMLGVEAEFDFTIPQAEIAPETFSVGRNAAVCAGNLNTGVIPGRCASIEPGISTLQVW